MTRSPCPRSDRLAAFLLGDVGTEELRAICDHLDACPPCQARADALDGISDELVGTLRQAAPAPAAADDELRRLAGAAKRLADPAAGPTPTRLGGYELLRRLGAGSFGTVYLARSRLLKRLVAVKVLHERHRGDPAVTARFFQEMEAVGRLPPHPNVVQALEATEADDALFLVMDYAEGLNLEEAVRGRGMLPVAVACEAVRQAALGLAHVHEHGLVHRDVKPGNLMATADGAVKVLDLGLARLAEGAADDRQTAAGQILGTFDYMAPEQARDPRLADARSDIYSLGCTLYRLLAGRVPFPGGNRQEKIDAHRSARPADLSGLRTDVPAALQALVGRMLAKDPADRPPTARAVAAALEPFARGADLRSLTRPSDKAAAVAVPSTVTYAAGRKKWVVVAIGAAVALLAVGFLLSLWRPAPGTGADAAASVTSLAGLKGPALSLAFSPDGKRLAASDGARLCAWDLDGGGPAVTWAPEGAASPWTPSNVAFTERDMVYIGWNDAPNRSALRPYDARNGAPTATAAPFTAAVLCLAAAPDGARLLAAPRGWVYVQDADTNGQVYSFEARAPVRAAAFSADGGRLACAGDDGVVDLYDIDGSKPQRISGPTPNSPSALAVGFSADGRNVYAASAADQTLRAWEAATARPFPDLRVAEGVDDRMKCAAFAGGRAATGHADGSVVVWDLKSRESRARYRRHDGPVGAVAFSADGRRVASAGAVDCQVFLYRLAGP